MFRQPSTIIKGEIIDHEKYADNEKWKAIAYEILKEAGTYKLWHKIMKKYFELPKKFLKNEKTLRNHIKGRSKQLGYPKAKFEEFKPLPKSLYDRKIEESHYRKCRKKLTKKENSKIAEAICYHSSQRAFEKSQYTSRLEKRTTNETKIVFRKTPKGLQPHERAAETRKIYHFTPAKGKRRLPGLRPSNRKKSRKFIR